MDWMAPEKEPGFVFRVPCDQSGGMWVAPLKVLRKHVLLSEARGNPWPHGTDCVVRWDAVLRPA